MAVRYSYYRCERCDVRFLGEAELPEDLYRFEKQHTVVASPSSGRYVHWDDDIVRELSRLVPRGRFLDFGSGYGDMLMAAHAAGYEAEGIDISPAFAEEARRRSGCTVFLGSIHEAGFAADHFDIINAHIVFEYVADLQRTFGELVRVLAPGGLMRIFLHAVDSLPALLRGDRWWLYAPTRRFVFSDRTIRYLANRHALAVARVIHGGEQSLANVRAQSEGASKRVRVEQRLRHLLKAVHVGTLSLSSARAYYLRKS